MLYVNNISIKLGERIKVGLEEHRVEYKKNGDMDAGGHRQGMEVWAALALISSVPKIWL